MNRSYAYERRFFVVCLFVLALLVVVDARARTLVVSGTYGLSPVLASSLLSVRRTVVCAVGATVASALSYLWNGNTGLDWWVRLAIVIALSITAIVIARTRVEREARLAQMSLVAETAQRAVLRALPAAVGPVGFAARYVSAAEEAQIGGDLYEVVDTSFGTRVVVGDVKGKGLEAVQIAATVLAAFRRCAMSEPELTGVARELDAVVSSVAGDEDFVTAILVEFGEGGRIGVVNLGHLPPILIGNGDPHAVRAMDTGQPVQPLGLHPDPVLAPGSWAPGMRMLLYTDGTTEGRDRAGRFFELPRAAAALADGTLDEALDTLVDALAAHVGHAIGDDVALVLAENRALGS